MGFMMLVNGLLVRRKVGGRGISKLERSFWKSMKETMSISTLGYFGGLRFLDLSLQNLQTLLKIMSINKIEVF